MYSIYSMYSVYSMQSVYTMYCMHSMYSMYSMDSINNYLKIKDFKIQKKIFVLQLEVKDSQNLFESS